MDQRFLADLNISPASVHALMSLGWDVVRSSDLLPADATDTEILARARELGRVIITQDLDFSALLALGGQSAPSLINLRLTSSEPTRITARLCDAALFLRNALREPCVITIEDATVRVRRLPMAGTPPSEAAIPGTSEPA